MREMIFQLLGYAKQLSPWSFEAVVVDIRTPRRAAETFGLSSSGRMSFNTLVFGFSYEQRFSAVWNCRTKRLCSWPVPFFWYNLLESDRWPDGIGAEFSLGLTQVSQKKIANFVGRTASQCGHWCRWGGVPELEALSLRCWSLPWGWIFRWIKNDLAHKFWTDIHIFRYLTMQ